MTIVAAVQMVSSDVLEENLALATQLISEAVSKQTKFVTLPENFALMPKHEAQRLAIKEAFGSGPIQTFLSDQAKQHQIWLLGGTIPIESDNPDKVYASSLLFSPNGRCLARYNKIHLFDVSVSEDDKESYRESASFEAGHEVVVASTDLGNIGLSICYDLRFPELYRTMHRDNVQIITVPSAFTYTTGKAHWELLVRARAVENLSYVIASNQGGKHANGRETWGHSMIVDPWGEILAEIKEGDGVATAEIDMEKQGKLRKSFPALAHGKLTGKLKNQKA